VKATSIQVVGGVNVSGTAKLSPTPVTGAKSVPDPLAGLAVPPAGPARTAVNLGGSSVLTINPGVYSQISVSGNAKLTMNPGIYEIAGGGFSVSGSGSVTGSGVLIYNAGSKYPSAGGTFGAVNLSGAGSVQLAPPTTGTYAGIVLFQSRDNTATISISGSAVAKLTGTFYAPAALVAVSGAAEFEPDALLVNELQFQGSGSMTSPNVIVGSSSTPQGPLALAVTGQASISSGPGGTSPMNVSVSSSPTRYPRGAARAKRAGAAAPVTASDAASSWPVTLGLAGVSTDEEESSSLSDGELLTDVAISVIDSQTGDRLTATTKKP